MVHALPQLFLSAAVLAVATLGWAPRWLISGAPALTYCLLAGAAAGQRVLPFVGTWTLIATLNLFYAIAATSWLLYWLFAAGCYPAILVTCLFQFEFAARALRKLLRSLLLTLHFTHDKIAFFDLPALEIDTEVDGLMVIRGVTVSLSMLTLVAHGVEVGIKISDDCEVALQVEEVRIPLFRKVEMGDVYANVKGGQFEMTFGNLAKHEPVPGAEPLMMSDTPLLQAAATMSQEDLVTMPERMTGGNAPEPVEPEKGLETVTSVSGDEEASRQRYEKAIKEIRETNNIHICREAVDKVMDGINHAQGKHFDPNSVKDRRAAICSQLHGRSTIAHPPRQSIRVTTLQNMGPPAVRRLLHRMPMLYRLLLNPISYFHPVHIASITAAGSGKWIEYLLQEKMFKHYADRDSSTRALRARLSAWLADANFALQLDEIKGAAQVPFIPGFDINAQLRFSDVLAYRTLPKEVDLKQVVRLGGADATVTVPMFLLPHHEHMLPPRPSKDDQRRQESKTDNADGAPQTVQLEAELERMRKDETTINISAHARLPACFDQELLNFVAVLVKATKMVEMEKDLLGDEDDDDDDDVDDDNDNDEKEGHGVTSAVLGFKASIKGLNSKVKDKIKRRTVSVVANDRWISKLVGKITKKLETAQGDIGYSGDIPVALDVYRDKAEAGSKIFP